MRRQTARRGFLFIDELHTVVRQRSNPARWAGSIIKPVLAAAILRCIGANHPGRLPPQRWRERNPALNRRFQQVGDPRTESEVSVEILRGLKRIAKKLHHASPSPTGLCGGDPAGRRYIADRWPADQGE